MNKNKNILRSISTYKHLWFTVWPSGGRILSHDHNFLQSDLLETYTVGSAYLFIHDSEGRVHSLDIVTSC